MSVIRHISPVSRYVNCNCVGSISGQLNQLHGWNRKCLAVIVYFGGDDGSGLEGLY